jgi:hypothetical protein
MDLLDSVDFYDKNPINPFNPINPSLNITTFAPLLGKFCNQNLQIIFLTYL